MAQEESSPIPLKYIDVTRTTLSNLDVLQAKRINVGMLMGIEPCQTLVDRIHEVYVVE